MNFSDFFTLNISGHVDIDFIDIDLDNDTKLFIDPSLIEGDIHSKWCINASKSINNFFDNIFECYTNNDTTRLYSLLDCGHEPNETKLGMSSGQPKGKGTSSQGLYEVFKDIINRNLLTNNLIKNPMDLCVFVHDFAEDRMSDLITNILRKELNEFTLKQCSKHNIPISNNEIYLGKTWNSILGSWEELKSKALLINNKPVLLVPKKIVRKKYIYSVGEYLNKKILPHRQEFHKNNNTSLAQLKSNKTQGEYIAPPSKKTVRKEEITGREKDYVTEQTLKNPSLICDFREDITRRIQLGEYTLRNEELDELLYENI